MRAFFKKYIIVAMFLIFIRNWFDEYCNITQSQWFYYRQRMNFGFCKIVRKIYVMPQAINACLAITGATRGTSKEKLYDELSLDSF